MLTFSAAPVIRPTFELLYSCTSSWVQRARCSTWLPVLAVRLIDITHTSLSMLFVICVFVPFICVPLEFLFSFHFPGFHDYSSFLACVYKSLPFSYYSSNSEDPSLELLWWVRVSDQSPSRDANKIENSTAANTGLGLRCCSARHAYKCFCTSYVDIYTFIIRNDSILKYIIALEHQKQDSIPDSSSCNFHSIPHSSDRRNVLQDSVWSYCTQVLMMVTRLPRMPHCQNDMLLSPQISDHQWNRWIALTFSF